MAYILVLLGLVGAFVWVSPARDGVRDALTDSTRALTSVARQYAPQTRERGSQLLSKLRAKAMDLFRKELHNAIDSQVQ